MSVAESEAMYRLLSHLKGKVAGVRIEAVEKCSRLLIHFEDGKCPPVCLFAVPGEYPDQHFIAYTPLLHVTLAGTPWQDALQFVSFENFGLRGCSLMSGYDDNHIVIRAGFIGRKGRTHDEIMSLIASIFVIKKKYIDLMQKIDACTVDGKLSLDRHHELYLNEEQQKLKAVAAPGIFTGDVPHILTQILTFIEEDLDFNVDRIDDFAARIVEPESGFQIILKTPEKLPLLTAWTPLYTVKDFGRALILAQTLNQDEAIGHFEISTDLLGFSAYKHLTVEMTTDHIEALLEIMLQSQQKLFEELEHEKSA